MVIACYAAAGGVGVGNVQKKFYGNFLISMLIFTGTAGTGAAPAIIACNAAYGKNNKKVKCEQILTGTFFIGVCMAACGLAVAAPTP